MNTYKGVIIEESLADAKVLEKVHIISTEVETVTEKFGTPWLSQWTLHTVEIPAEEVEEIADMVAGSLDAEHSAAWYADFKNDTFHYIVFCDKVFKVARESRKAYREAYDYGKALGTPAHQLIQYPGIDTKRIAKFLDAANKNTYANPKVKKAPSLRPKSNDYHFEDGQLAYHDTYFGSREFIGEEVIYHTGRPVWGANYYGTLSDENMPESTLAKFLRKALMQKCVDIIPVRGPKHYAEGEWEYRFNPEGDLSKFTGFEEISYKGNVVFQLGMHGGFIG